MNDDTEDDTIQRDWYKKWEKNCKRSKKLNKMMEKKIFHHKNVNYLYLHFRFNIDWVPIFLHAKKSISSNTNKTEEHDTPSLYIQIQFISLPISSIMTRQKKNKYTKSSDDFRVSIFMFFTYYWHMIGEIL